MMISFLREKRSDKKPPSKETGIDKAERMIVTVAIIVGVKFSLPERISVIMDHTKEPIAETMRPIKRIYMGFPSPWYSLKNFMVFKRTAMLLLDLRFQISKEEIADIAIHDLIDISFFIIGAMILDHCIRAEDI